MPVTEWRNWRHIYVTWLRGFRFWGILTSSSDVSVGSSLADVKYELNVSQTAAGGAVDVAGYGRPM